MSDKYPFISEYLKYRREFRKAYGSSKRYMEYDQFESICLKEEEQERREWEDHIQRVNNSRRYI